MSNTHEDAERLSGLLVFSYATVMREGEHNGEMPYFIFIWSLIFNIWSLTSSRPFQMVDHGDRGRRPDVRQDARPDRRQGLLIQIWIFEIPAKNLSKIATLSKFVNNLCR